MESKDSSQKPGEAEVVVMVSSRAIISGILTPATIVISVATGKITSVSKTVLPESEFKGQNISYKDYSPWVLMPGLVDAHVHLNEPGRTEWEGFYTGTQAAAFGGVTTVIDMPLNSIPPTTTVPWLEEKVKAAEGQCWVDYAFYGGLVPNNASELKSLVMSNVKGFKGFLIDSGVCIARIMLEGQNTVAKLLIGGGVPGCFLRRYQICNGGISKREDCSHVPR